MFKSLELSDDKKELVEERLAQESCAEQLKEEQYRRRWCVEQATHLEEIKAEGIIPLADKIYNYVYGAKE